MICCAYSREARDVQSADAVASVRRCDRSDVGVVAVAGARDEARLRELDFDTVIFIWLVWWRRVERDFVPGVRVEKALLDLGGEVVVADEGEAAGLRREHLNAQIGVLRIFGLGDSLEKILVVIRPAKGFIDADWIEVVQRDVALPQGGRKINNIAEIPCNSLGVR